MTPAPLNLRGNPPLLTLFPPPIQLSTPPPRWLGEPILFPDALEVPPPSHQERDTVKTLLCLNEVGGELADKVLLEWALDTLCSLEDWRWLWSPELAMTTSLLTIPPNPQPLLLSLAASSASPWNTYTPNAQSTSAPFAERPPPDTPSTLAPCAPAQFVESLVMWAPVAQLLLQPTLPLSLPEWATLEGFESVPQEYDGGNVTIEEPPISFSLFTLADCMALSHFSFNDFIAIAFLDLAEDLEIPI